MRVRWTSNKRAGDNTSRIKLNGHSDDDPRIFVRGEEGELTQEEYDKYSQRYRFAVLDADEEGEQEEQDQEAWSDEESDDDERVD